MRATMWSLNPATAHYSISAYKRLVNEPLLTFLAELSEEICPTNAWFENSKHCLAEGCRNPIDNHQVGLCKRCFKIQSDVAKGTDFNLRSYNDDDTAYSTSSLSFYIKYS